MTLVIDFPDLDVADSGLGTDFRDGAVQLQTTFANIKAAVELEQGRLWTLDNTARTLALGERVQAETHAGIIDTLPASFTRSGVDYSDIWVWNSDSDSNITLDPDGTDEIFLNGTGLGAGVALTLYPGQIAICSPRVTDVSWDVFVSTDYASGSPAPLTCGALTCGDFTSTGITDTATTARVFLMEDDRVRMGIAGSGFGLYHIANDQNTIISGGNDNVNGANIVLWGATTAAVAKDMQFRSSGTDTLYYDDSASSWDFQANAIITTGALTCGTFTSTGIDDNTTAERFQISDTLLVYGASGVAYGIQNAANDQFLSFSGGTGSTQGGMMRLYGESHATSADDIQFWSGGSLELQLDQSSSTWNFQANTVKWGMGTADLPFFDFVATADADTTSAISTLTTPGSITNFVQADINGTKRWIAVYADPS